MVGQRIGVPARGLGPYLFLLKDYCETHNWPPLTVLVVAKGDGTPSGGYGNNTNADAEREQVFAFEWYKQIPITESDLQQAEVSNKVSSQS
jgi:hypothetical protein